MDFADGGDLNMKIKEQNGKLFPENKILDWFTQVCLAIKHIHDRKILHRDIKSQNIFLMKNGQVKLGDFGIAKCLNQTIDKAKTYVGTPYYLSPEIINSQPYDFKSDIWSLGVLLYEMCALKMPFDAANLPQLYIKIINCNYQPLSNYYSNDLKKLIKSMLNETSLKRPNIGEILSYKIIQPRIKKFLSDDEFEAEFSHTVLHNFIIDSKQNEKITKNDLINDVRGNFMNMKVSQGHQKPYKIDSNLHVSGSDPKYLNYHYQKDLKEKEQMERAQQYKIDILKKELLGDAQTIHFVNKNKYGAAKYGGNNNNVYNSNNHNKNNINNKYVGGFFYLNSNYNKDNKKVEIKNSKKAYGNKNVLREELSSDKVAKGLKNYANNNDIKDSYNKQRGGDSSKHRNSYKKQIEVSTNNNTNNVSKKTNNNNYGESSNSYREKEKERKQNLEEFKKKMKQNKKKSNQDDLVIWMKGMENYSEKKNYESNKIDLFDIEVHQKEDSLNGNNNNDSELNINELKNNNNYNEECWNEEEINNNNKLYEDLMKGGENYNNGGNIKEYNLTESLNFNYEKNPEINEDKIDGDISKELDDDFGKELTKNISQIIKKYVNDDMLTYDYDKLTETIHKDLSYKKIPSSTILKAINKIPDIYYLILRNKL